MIDAMPRFEKLLQKMRSSPKNIRFDELCAVCDHYFGSAHTTSGSHRFYPMPWRGDPLVNIQEGKNGSAKAYQVRQVLQAIDKLEEDE